MTTTGVGATQPDSTNQLKGSNFALKTEDFINLMITQLKNQDPTDPVKNQDLLAQMSQIGSLQASTSLQDSLKSLVMQNNLGSAGNLIGKTVQGMDDQNNTISGLVTSVQVQGDQVNLELDNGKNLQLGRVTAIMATPGQAAAATTTPPPAAG
jgi:flagellar basal-body rod modification protein FlgD